MRTPYGEALDDLERTRLLLTTIKQAIEAHDIQQEQASELRGLLERIHRDVCIALK